MMYVVLVITLTWKIKYFYTSIEVRLGYLMDTLYTLDRFPFTGMCNNSICYKSLVSALYIKTNKGNKQKRSKRNGKNIDTY